jgi:glycosyltransferase involved in cell wall biosynthesis
MGGPGAVAQRARADLRAGAQCGARMVGLTDALTRPIPQVDVRVALPRSPVGLPPGPTGELLAVAAVTRVLQRVAQEVRPDAVVFHSSTLSWSAVKVARRLRSRAVFVVHALIADRLAQGSSPYGPVTTALYARANRHALQRSDRVVCVSAYMGRIAVREGAPQERVRVLSNTVSLEDFTPGGGPKTIDVLFAGRLSIEKGVDTLIRAASDLPGLRITVAGDGPAGADLRALAERLDVRATFLGSQTRAQVATLMRAARLLVVPSRSEPQGVVVLEALACGLPVVASAVGGLPELVEPGGTGWLVPPDDPAALRTAIAGALKDDEHLRAVAARARQAAEAYGADALARGFANAYL